MNRYKITIVVGARPNFVKVAPIIHEIQRLQFKSIPIDFRLVHTGQHYDKNMSSCFFDQLQIPDPDANLGCHTGTQIQQIAHIMIAFEKELMANKAHLVLVVGDVTSSMACAITAQRLHVKVAHIEAGLRSSDWSMPEEINRLIIDSISNYLFTTSSGASQNLINEKINEPKVFFVGNTMIDTLMERLPYFKKPDFYDSFKLKSGNYLVVTLHRPSNVDNRQNLNKLITEIINNTRNLLIVFPMHPRTAKVFNSLKIDCKRLHVVHPMSYLEFNYLIQHSKAVITDSGGITEETSILNIPCLTLRNNTERPITVDLGTNELVGTDPNNIKVYLDRLFNGQWKTLKKIPLWDGKTSKRILKILINEFDKLSNDA
ncbi:non-hydrolyzing UDP-N-acetylglucosamine 2-epimerase [Flavivirga sp. 57AJ16]|uniref:non-hydrolyzing UDP-N-acetylglucosamine 2-epimerase n=1 Tax=Flavivirga sp. 57AJ16 TaxID=3025307 RepID=UPI0023660CBD|nr:UDP-N-acetylglucosamine 2-epimerase (non-hydrolyzing) [Flavivirga sp. 57AJ16]MDD7886247.1 UDP-N-acetylglucosamine 2-epimerase (non-hydrolyzing) [Flavivirga sp. 57AJ16]